MITWKEDADIEGWVGDIDTQWVLEMYPHAKDGWSWTESAYLDWRDVIEGRKPADEHDETAEIVAHAVAQERAAVVAFLREQASQWDRDAAGWAALNHASVMIERGLHRAGEGA